jgi:hypothetical protein
MIFPRWILVLTAALVLATLGGCRPPKAKPVPVHGTVTLNGEPLPEGMLYFKTPQTGALESFEVKNGEFAGKAEVGERRVEIAAYRTRMIDVGPMKREARENILPPKYNTNSQLTATVTPDGPNTFSFQLTTK